MSDSGTEFELPELPQNWVWTTIGEAFEVCIGATPSRKEVDYWDGDIPWVSSGEVKFCRIRTTRESITQLGFSKTSTILHPPGTVLLGMIGEGKTRGQVALLNIEACNNQNSAAIRVADTGIVPEYIYYFLEGEYENTRRMSSGNNQPALNKTRVRAMRFPLSPLAEQHRIVNKIEELFTELDAGVALLKKLKIKLKRYRQSVLKAAVEGKLTQDWREAHQDELEPASVLLERILKERREKWEAEQLAKMAAKGKVPKNDKWKLKYKEPTAPDTAEFPTPPKGWSWLKLETLCTAIADVDHKMPKAETSGIPYVSPKDFYGDNGINFESAKKISKDSYQHLCRKIYPKQGDLLLSRYGTIGEVRLVSDERLFQASYSIAIIKPVLEEISVFLATVLRSNIVQAQIQKYVRGVTQLDLGLGHIRELLVPFPSAKEQLKIVQEAEYLFSLIDQIDQLIDNNLKRSKSLRQSILKQAFEGKLVLQDSAEEEASVLLERIQSEKAQKEMKKKGKEMKKKGKKKTRAKKKKSPENKRLELVDVSSRQEAT